MIILGIVLVPIGLVAKIAILQTVGLILLLVGVVLMVLGTTGRAVAGRRHYWWRRIPPPQPPLSTRPSPVRP